ncbi:protein FMC1 homolog isoform X2 [Plodia interpunctella]|uniref:protein FMC1 homolog isoform X2 n=1 Tax=Plodia interpunctella TaxID=58824 RepID=UPI0023689D42|nr:protein FMC1 homolog isoform X2 [Plodia interpunctella]
MSKSSFDIEGFQIVKSKKSSKKQTRLPRRDINFVKQELEVDIDTVITCKMASITSKPTLVTLRQLLSEIRKQSTTKKLSENQMVRYIMSQYRKYQVTDQHLCKAIDEMHFKAKTYCDYLQYSRRYMEINVEFKGRGERTVAETAKMVGFKLPHDPKP